MKNKKEDVAKSLVSLVVAQVRNGGRKTRRGKINSRNAEANEKPGIASGGEHDHIITVQPSKEEVSAQLQKFENMVIIQRLDRLVDMQKMQWEILNRLTNLLETMTAIAANGPEEEQDLEDEYSGTAALDELLKADQSDTDSDKSQKDKDMSYEAAEVLARKIARVKNEIN